MAFETELAKNGCGWHAMTDYPIGKRGCISFFTCGIADGDAGRILVTKARVRYRLGVMSDKGALWGDFERNVFIEPTNRATKKRVQDQHVKALNKVVVKKLLEDATAFYRRVLNFDSLDGAFCDMMLKEAAAELAA